MDNTAETTSTQSDPTVVAVDTVEGLKHLIIELHALGVKFTAVVEVNVKINGEAYTSRVDIEDNYLPTCSHCGSRRTTYDSDMLMTWCFDCEQHGG